MTVIDVEEAKIDLKSKETSKKYNNDLDDKNDDIHFAIDGATFNIIKEYFPEEAKNIWVKGTVFARMSPDQKESLIGMFNLVTFIVMFF